LLLVVTARRESKLKWRGTSVIAAIVFIATFRAGLVSPELVACYDDLVAVHGVYRNSKHLRIPG